MGLMQRNKGKAFERRLATILREHWPSAVVRRASQADRAHQSDVYVTGGPSLLSRLWLEAQDARVPTPLVKLEQAERDVHLTTIGVPAAPRLPVVVWHKLGARDIHATMRMETLDAVRGVVCPPKRIVWDDRDTVVTMLLPSLIEIVAAVTATATERAA